jgi:hypothetical protein
MDTFGANFASARKEGTKGIYVSAQPLYWKGKVGEADYAMSVKSNAATFTISVRPPFGNLNFPVVAVPYSGTVKENAFGWNLGGRIALGYHFDHDCWDTNINYTTYQNNQTDHVSKSEPSYVRPTTYTAGPALGLGAYSFLFKAAKSHYDIGYNNVNWELGRSYYVSQRLSLSPSLGAQSCWLDLKRNIHYTLTFFQGTSNREDTTIKVNSKSYLWGIGPRFGINSAIYLGDGFSISSNLATGLLYGYFRSNVHIKPDGNSILASEDPDAGLRQTLKINQKNHRFTPNVQMFIGLIWETYMMENTKHLTLGAGYEVNYIWRGNQMLAVNDSSTAYPLNPANTAPPPSESIDSLTADVMMYGMTFKVALEF